MFRPNRAWALRLAAWLNGLPANAAVPRPSFRAKLGCLGTGVVLLLVGLFASLPDTEPTSGDRYSNNQQERKDQRAEESEARPGATEPPAPPRPTTSTVSFVSAFCAAPDLGYSTGVPLKIEPIEPATIVDGRPVGVSDLAVSLNGTRLDITTGSGLMACNGSRDVKVPDTLQAFGLRNAGDGTNRRFELPEGGLTATLIGTIKVTTPTVSGHFHWLRAGEAEFLIPAPKLVPDRYYPNTSICIDADRTDLIGSLGGTHQIRLDDVAVPYWVYQVLNGGGASLRDREIVLYVQGTEGPVALPVTAITNCNRSKGRYILAEGDDPTDTWIVNPLVLNLPDGDLRLSRGEFLVVDGRPKQALIVASHIAVPSTNGSSRYVLGNIGGGTTLSR